MREEATLYLCPSVPLLQKKQTERRWRQRAHARKSHMSGQGQSESERQRDAEAGRRAREGGRERAHTHAGALALVLGSVHTCALLAGGAVKCWGNNDNGQLGIGSNSMQTTPQAVALGAGERPPRRAPAVGRNTRARARAHTHTHTGNPLDTGTALP